MATDIYPTKPIADITEINDSHRLMAHYRAALRTSWRRSVQNTRPAAS